MARMGLYSFMFTVRSRIRDNSYPLSRSWNSSRAASVSSMTWRSYHSNTNYRGKSIAGTFYEYELHRATHPDIYLVEKVLRRRGNKIYVKWLGFDGSHNSWIHKDNALWK